MGSCAFKKPDKTKSLTPAIQLQYSRQALIKIRTKNQSTTNSDFSEIAFHLSEPQKIFSDSISISNTTVHISYSIIPGLDPRHDSEKNCQDNCFMINSDDCIFLGLYDGHGVNGDKVSSLCVDLGQSLFSELKNFVTFT